MQYAAEEKGSCLPNYTENILFVEKKWCSWQVIKTSTYSINFWSLWRGVGIAGVVLVLRETILLLLLLLGVLLPVSPEVVP